MKHFICIIAMLGILKSYSQDNSIDTIWNTKPLELYHQARVDSIILRRHIIIDTSKIGSYINFYEIDNQCNGKWVNINKGYWGYYFGNKIKTGTKVKPLNWEEWYEGYQKGTITSPADDGVDGYEDDYLKYKGDFKGHKPNGNWIINSGINGITVSGNFNEGKPNGEWIYSLKTKDRDGEGAIVKETIFRKEFYNNGIPDGKWICSFNDIIIEENFVNGKPSGSRNVYHNPNKDMNILTKGDLLHQLNFVDGYPDGQSYFYDYYIKGSIKKKILIRKALYKLGKPVEVIRFTGESVANNDFCKTEFIESSNIVRNHIYKNGKLSKTIEIDKLKNNFSLHYKNFRIDDYSIFIWRQFTAGFSLLGINFY